MLDRAFLGKERLEKIRRQQKATEEAREEAGRHTLTQEDLETLGSYGQQLQDLNKRRYDMSRSLSIFDGDESSLDIDEIREHMGVLYNDAYREAQKLARVSSRLDLGERPDMKLKEQISKLAKQVDKTTDPAIRENLIETANSKTKALLELGKISIYTTRVQTKVTRLDAFLGELQLGAMRAGLEEDSDYHRTELANSMKTIRSSFAAVDDYHRETKLLSESQEKQDEEVPYYIRYKEVWAGKEAAEEPDPPQRTPDHQEDIERMNTIVETAGGYSSITAYPEYPDQDDRLTSPDNATVECPICRATISFEPQPKDVKVLCICNNLLEIRWLDERRIMNVAPLSCPKCSKPGPFEEVSITYSDGLRRFRCSSCNRYSSEEEIVEICEAHNWAQPMNAQVNRSCTKTMIASMSDMIAEANSEYSQGSTNV